MRVKIMQQTLQVTSNITKRQLAQAKTFAPDALKIKDADGNEVYAVGPSIAAKDGSVSKFGITFNGHNAQGQLTLTMPIPFEANVEKREKAVKEQFGNALAALAQNEDIVITHITAAVGAVELAFENAEVEGRNAETVTEETEA